LLSCDYINSSNVIDELLSVRYSESHLLIESGVCHGEKSVFRVPVIPPVRHTGIEAVCWLQSQCASVVVPVKISGRMAPVAQKSWTLTVVNVAHGQIARVLTVMYL